MLNNESSQYGLWRIHCEKRHRAKEISDIHAQISACKFCEKKFTTVVWLCVWNEDIVDFPSCLLKLLFQNINIQAPEFLVWCIHQGCLIFSKNEETIVGSPILQPAWYTSKNQDKLPANLRAKRLQCARNTFQWTNKRSSVKEKAVIGTRALGIVVCFRPKMWEI